MAFIGDPPLMRPEADEVHVSCTFTWDKERATRLWRAWGQYYPTKLGGPAFDVMPGCFVPGMYLKEGVTFTSRGCNNRCPWCLVPHIEGSLVEYDTFPVGNIVQDNNLLQCSQSHLKQVFTMLKGQRAIEFTGGLDARLMTSWIADQIRAVRVKQLFLACDTDKGLEPLRNATRLLAMPKDKVRCYVLCGFNQTIAEAEERLRQVWDTGAIPFAQLYQPSDRWIKYPQGWRDLARTWSRPAATKSHMKGPD
jgi:hypothetical protein